MIEQFDCGKITYSWDECEDIYYFTDYKTGERWKLTSEQADIGYVKDPYEWQRRFLKNAEKYRPCGGVSNEL